MSTPAQAAVEQLARDFLALEVLAMWRPTFDAWAIERGLSAEVRRAVVVAILRERVFHASARHQARRRA